MTIKEIVERLLAEKLKPQIIVGLVKSVDESNMTCVIDVSPSPDLLDVRLRSVIDSNDSGVLVIPKKGSYVLVAIINNMRQSTFICGFSEVEKIRMLSSSIELSGNNKGGLLISEKVTAEINEIKQDLNTLKTVFKTFAPIPQTGGADIKAAAVTWAGQTLTPAKQTDLENKNVKHGN